MIFSFLIATFVMSVFCLFFVCSTKIGEISDISKCFEDFVSQALGVLTRIYAAELRYNTNKKVLMKKLLVLIIFCCYHAASLYAQQSILLPDADAISFDHFGHDIEVYTKIGPNQYTRQSLQIEEKTRLDNSPNIVLIGWKINPHKDTLSKSDIDKLPKRFIEAKDLHAIALDSYVGKAFNVNDSGQWKRETYKSTYVLKFLRQDLAVMQQLVYMDGRRTNDGCSLSSHIPDSVVTWRSTRSEYFVPLILEIRGGKKIFLLYDRYITYMVFPSPKGGLAFKLYSPYPGELTMAGKEYDDAKSYDFQYFNKKRFYDVQKTETEKYRLFNRLGQDVLKEEYDSINNGRRFTIAKRGNDIDVFNLYNKKLNIGKVKVAREVETFSSVGCIEILNEEGAYYYDEMGNKLKHPIMGSIGVCGTVSRWTHNILKNKGNYQVQIYTSYPDASGEDERYWLSGLLPTDVVTFLDGEKSFFQSENSSLCGDIDVRPEWIRVGRKGKFGIIAYEYKRKKNVKPKLVTKRIYNWNNKILVYPPIKVVGKTIFPIDNDSIIMRPDGLIYFYKDKKVGLFPHDKAPVYDEIKKVTDSFYHIVKEGTPGWLDIKTNKEYGK